jgi:hypothetical protein
MVEIFHGKDFCFSGKRYYKVHGWLVENLGGVLDTSFVLVSNKIHETKNF